MSNEPDFRQFNPKPTWNSRGGDDLVEGFYKPALKNNCNLYQRMSGFFTSTSFSHVVQEILDFIERDGKIELITSPNLSTMDKETIEQSVDDPEKLISEIFFKDLKNDLDNLKINFAKLLGYMLTHNKLEIKIAINKDRKGMYHDKIGIMHFDDGEKISFSGSANETSAAWKFNSEQLEVFTTWGGDRDNISIRNHQRWFNRVWQSDVDELEIFNLPVAVKDHLLEISPKSDEEHIQVMEKIKETLGQTSKKSKMGLYDYQKDARDEWIKNGCNGLFAMATGTGKTFAAFSCMNKIQNTHERTAIIIACPQKHLVEQWYEELSDYNSGMPEEDKVDFSTSVLCNSDYPKWRDDFDKILDQVNEKPLGYSEFSKNNFIVFVTHATLGKVGHNSFNEKIDSIKGLKKFIIIDEVHNITEESSKTRFREDYDFRLGLSATPDRHLDTVGTDIIYNYFDKAVYDLSLKRAIKEGYLCKYHYYPTYVELTVNEAEIYDDLTTSIAIIEEKKSRGAYHPEKGEFDPYLARAQLIQAAANKLDKLKEILTDMRNSLEQTLVYCTSNPSLGFPKGAPTQLIEVQKILSARNIVSDSVTWRDKTKDRRKILRDLANDHFDCVTAVRCLDEGVDIPSVKLGIFMASSGNPKQFIQRRGRVLRKSEKTGKTRAKIYDILVTPHIPDEDNIGTVRERKLIANELLRCKEFASLSDNEDVAKESIGEILEGFKIPYETLTREWITENIGKWTKDDDDHSPETETDYSPIE
jgi:superfamily II DNA or RNA helicase